MDVIDLSKARADREAPDADCIRKDEYGRPLFCFMGIYQMDGREFSVEVWAYTWDEAERHAAAMGNVTIAGQKMAEEPA